MFSWFWLVEKIFHPPINTHGFIIPLTNAHRRHFITNSQPSSIFKSSVLIMNTKNQNFKILESNKENTFYSYKDDLHPLRVLTGTVDKAIHWAHQIKDRVPILYEIYAYVVSAQQGAHNTEKVLLIQDEKNTRCMKVIYYEIDMPLGDFPIGSVVRCIGKLISREVLQAYMVTPSSLNEKIDVQRNAFICNFTIVELLKFI